MARNCANCAFVVHQNHPHVDGFCHFNPTAVPIRGMARHWCGQWKPDEDTRTKIEREVSDKIERIWNGGEL